MGCDKLAVAPGLCCCKTEISMHSDAVLVWLHISVVGPEGSELGPKALISHTKCKSTADRQHDYFSTATSHAFVNPAVSPPPCSASEGLSAETGGLATDVARSISRTRKGASALGAAPQQRQASAWWKRRPPRHAGCRAHRLQVNLVMLR